MEARLGGLRVLFLRPVEEAGEAEEAITRLGGTPVHVELIRREEPRDPSGLDRALGELESYDWIVFTSRSGVKALSTRARALGVDLQRIKARIAAVGPATRGEVERSGLRVSYMPSRYLTTTLAEELPDVDGRRVLLVRSEGVGEEMLRILRRRGASAEQVYAYRVEASKIREPLPLFDAVILTSPSTAAALREALGDGGDLRGVIVCCIGPVTARAARALGMRVDVVSERSTFGGAVEALARRVSGLE